MLNKLLQAFSNTQWNLGGKTRTYALYLLSKQAAQTSLSPPRGTKSLIDFNREKTMPLCVVQHPSANSEHKMIQLDSEML